VISLGCNDVPAPGGGLYSTDHGEADQRDFARGEDSNDARKQRIVDSMILTMREHFLPEMSEEEILTKARPLLEETLVSDVTEFGRSVHAEMDALMAAGRIGVSFRNATLYTTTFPCHTCTRHIIAAGLKRVVYIEPYPKSLAPELHGDAIRISKDDPSDSGQIPFEPFLGIGPRRFFDLFSLKLSSGRILERKAQGAIVNWNYRRDSKPRVPMASTSYLEREQLIHKTIELWFLKDTNVTTTGTTSEERRGVLGTGEEDRPPSRRVAALENRRTSDSSRASGEEG
jgi:deoxycytidylate deaminase